VAYAPQETSTGLMFREVTSDEELNEVHDLQKNVLRLGGHKDRVHITGSGVVIAAILGERIIGAGHVTKRAQEDLAEIYCLAVDSDFQGYGIGTELLAKLEEVAIDEEATTTELTTYDAEDFYANNGYRLVGRVVARTGLVQKYMVKNLASNLSQRGQV
jgi:N-acetylglutamate synthase-like GNAT family acetyltransferase